MNIKRFFLFIAAQMKNKSRRKYCIAEIKQKKCYFLQNRSKFIRIAIYFVSKKVKEIR